jgi:hypothetical protein
MGWLWIAFLASALAQAPTEDDDSDPGDVSNAQSGQAPVATSADPPQQVPAPAAEAAEVSAEDKEAQNVLSGDYRLSANVDVPRGFRRQHLSWSGGKMAMRGSKAVNARKFAALTGDDDTAKMLRRKYLPMQITGWSLASVGVGSAIAGTGLVGLSLITFLGEGLVCAFSSGNPDWCQFPWTKTLLLYGGAFLGAGVVVSGVGVTLVLSLVRPKLVLLNWYTDEEVHEAVELYNRALADEYEVDVTTLDVTTWSPPRTGGELVLEPAISGFQLRATF